MEGSGVYDHDQPDLANILIETGAALDQFLVDAGSVCLRPHGQTRRTRADNSPSARVASPALAVNLHDLLLWKSATANYRDAGVLIRSNGYARCRSARSHESMESRPCGTRLMLERFSNSWMIPLAWLPPELFELKSNSLHACGGFPGHPPPISGVFRWLYRATCM